MCDNNENGNRQKENEVKKVISNLGTAKVLFLLGGIFIVLAGLVFATTSWNMLSGEGKVFVFTLCTTLLFTCSGLAEKKLGLEKTGGALFNIGCGFLPILVIAIGYFDIMGGLLSFERNQYIVYMISSLVLGIGAMIGGNKYGHKLYGYVICGCVTISVVTALMGMGVFGDKLGLCIAVFTLITVVLEKMITELLGEDNIISLVYKKYVWLNTGVLGIVIMIITNTGVVSSLAMGIYSIVFLSRIFNDEDNIIGAYIFIVTLSVGLFKLILPESMDNLLLVITALITTLTVLNMLDVFSAKMKCAFSTVSVLILICTVSIMSINILNIYKWSASTHITIGIMALDTLILGLGRNKNKGMLTLHSIMMLLFLIGINRFTVLNEEIIRSLFIISTVAVYVVYYSIKNIPLRSSVTDVFYVIVLLICGIVSWDEALAYKEISYSLLCILSISGAIAITAMVTRLKNSEFISKVFNHMLPITIFFLIEPIMFLINATEFRAWDNRYYFLWFAVAVISFIYYMINIKYKNGALERVGVFGINIASIVIGLKAICEGNNILIICVLFISVIAYAMSLKRRNNIIGILSMLTAVQAMVYIFEFNWDTIGILIAVNILAIVGKRVHKRLLNTYEKIDVDWISYGIISVIFVYGDSIFEYGWSIGILISAVAIVFYGRSRSSTVNNIVAMVAALGYSIAWWSQEVISIPDIISTELNLLPTVIMCTVAMIISKKHKSIVEAISFCVGISNMLWLSLMAMNTERIEDLIIILVISAVMLVAAHMVKRLRWFILAVIVIICLSVYASKSFWLSMAWWIYLLITGIILIALAVYDEWKKKNRDVIGEAVQKWYRKWKW